MRLGPGSDPWMVRVTISEPRSTLHGVVRRYTAVDLAEDDPTPGVHPLLVELGRLHRSRAGAPFQVVRQHVAARNDAEARQLSAAMYDAARGFLELGLPPNPGAPTALQDTARLTVEIGDARWSFASSAAPAAAWAVLRAAGFAGERAFAPA